MDEELDPRELERDRRRDREMAAERRALMRPGAGKVFKQIRDRQVESARDLDERSSGRPAAEDRRRDRSRDR